MIRQHKKSETAAQPVKAVISSYADHSIPLLLLREVILYPIGVKSRLSITGATNFEAAEPHDAMFD
jgi:hypothetical protein